MFKIWRDKWEIFDHKFCQGFLIYTYKYNSYNKIEEYYSKYIQNEMDTYLDNIEKLNKNDSQKIKILGYENGLDTNCENSEIIMDLKKIKKMELIISLTKEIDGNELVEIPQVNDKETSKIERILKSLNQNYNNNNNINNENNNTILNLKDGKNESENNKITEEAKIINNNENSVVSIKNNEEYYDDIDGEPL